MTELMRFPPRWGSGPHSTTVTSGVHAQRSARGGYSVRSDVLSPGFMRQGVGVWKRTVATTIRYDDRLAYTSLIQRNGPSLHRHRTWRERCNSSGLLLRACIRRPLHRLRFGPDAVPQYTHLTTLNGAVRNRERVTTRWLAAHPTRFLTSLKRWVSALWYL
jgi:hypothetical protein